jgi:hypothetical protein
MKGGRESLITRIREQLGVKFVFNKTSKLGKKISYGVLHTSKNKLFLGRTGIYQVMSVGDPWQ